MAGNIWTLTLKSVTNKILAKKDTSTIGTAIANGITAAIGSVAHTAVVVTTKNPSSGSGTPTSSEPVEMDVGFVEDTQLAQLTESTVSIPQNFAGLEAVMVPTRLMYQLFEITEVVENDGYVEVTALHIFYRQRNNYTLWKPNESLKYSGASACRNVLTNAMFDSGFLVASDCTDLIIGSDIDVERKNIVEAFLDPESGICAKYDLNLIRNNDTFYCLKEVGYDRGFVVENKKNLLGVERTENIENVVTRVAPVGKDEDGEYVWLNYNGLKYIDSTHINDYTMPKAEILYTDIKIGEDDVTSSNIQAKLLEAAQKRFSEDEADLPEVTMTVQFLSLGDTEEYEQYRGLDKVYLYDIIHIKDTERGYDYSAQVVSVEHNVLTGMLESVTIGTPKRGNGKRKISVWQVPEVAGAKIRNQTINAGSFKGGAVRTNDIKNQAVVSDHFSTSADDHVKSLADGQITTDLTPTMLNDLISQITTLTGINASFSGDMQAAGFYIGNTNVGDGIAALRMNGSTLQYKKFSDTSWQNVPSV